MQTSKADQLECCPLYAALRQCGHTFSKSWVQVIVTFLLKTGLVQKSALACNRSPVILRTGRQSVQQAQLVCGGRQHLIAFCRWQHCIPLPMNKLSWAHTCSWPCFQSQEYCTIVTIICLVLAAQFRQLRKDTVNAFADLASITNVQQLCQGPTL